MNAHDVAIAALAHAQGDPDDQRGTKWHQLERGGGATPFPLLDLESRDANSIPYSQKTRPA